MGTIANAKVTHYYNCYNGDFIGCLLFSNPSPIHLFTIYSPAVKGVKG